MQCISLTVRMYSLILESGNIGNVLQAISDNNYNQAYTLSSNNPKKHSVWIFVTQTAYLFFNCDIKAETLYIIRQLVTVKKFHLLGRWQNKCNSFQ